MDINKTQELCGFIIKAYLIDGFTHVNFHILDPLYPDWRCGGSINKDGSSGWNTDNMLRTESYEQSQRFGMALTQLHILAEKCFSEQKVQIRSRRDAHG